MKVKDLRALLANIDDELEVMVETDHESFEPASDIGPATLVDENLPPITVLIIFTNDDKSQS